MAYSPTNHLALNKPPAVSGPNPDSAKNMFYDTTKFAFRPFQSVDEASSYFKAIEKNPSYEVLINTSALNDSTGTFADPTALKVYWFMDYINLTEKRQTVDLSDYITNETLETNYYDKDDINTKLSSIFHYKGSVDNYTDLPTDNTIGDVWNIVNADTTNKINAGDNVAWTGTAWDVLAGFVDLSAYAIITQVNSLIATALTSANAYTDQQALLKENTSNKSTDGTLGEDTPSDTLFPSQKAVKTYADSIKTNFWYEEFVFTATQETGATFTLLHAPINFLPSFLNEAKLSPVSDIQVDTSTLVLTLNRQITIGFEYKLQLYYNF